VTLSETLHRALLDLAPEARRALVAVSGGGDSVALLRLLLTLPELRGGLEVAHLDHALHPDSAEAAAFVRALCLEHGVPCHTGRADVARVAQRRGWNLEEAARRLRYSFLTRTAKRVGAEVVVTAHTQDDQAETVLMQLLRGAAHLQGMPARQGGVVRPLLGVPRSALRAYLEALGQSFVDDPTNADTSRTRAWVRHALLPLLEARAPQVKKTLARHAALQRDQKGHFRRLAQGLVGEGGADARALMAQDAAVQRAALAELLRRAGVPVDADHLEAVRAALPSARPVRLSLPRGYTARVAYGRLELVAPTAPAPPAPLLEPPRELDPEKLAAFPGAHVRTRRPGDRVRLPGGRKKLADLLIDRKVPREVRDRLRVLAAGREVLWVEGVFVDPRVARAQPALDEDARWMQLALEAARRAAEMGELPVGAVVVRRGQVLGRGHNTTRESGDPTAHAELHALRRAAAAVGDWRLGDCTLYVTLEPCPMCFGAALAAHLPRVVYGATNRREGALGGTADLQQHPWKRTLAVRGGVLAAEAGALLTGFFEARRPAR
jgi:tRNA(Ile)-lysidine synthase